jgi:LysM repeat protein
LKKDPDKASILIGEALNSGSLKSLPDDAIFYLARTKQMQGKYDEAERTFRRFTAEAGKKRARDLNVQEYIQECKDRTGKVDIQKYEAIVQQPAVQPVVADTATETSQPLPAEVEKELGQKLDIQFSVDSAEASLKEKLPVPVVPENKPEITTQVPTVVSVVTSTDTVKPIVREFPKPEPVVQTTSEVKDTTIKIREILSKSIAVYSVFEVFPQPVNDPKATIEINPRPPEGLIYRIQMAVFRNPIQLSYFKGISPIYGLKGPGATVTTYYAGLFRQSAEASKALTRVKAKGFKDSFVVAQVGNKTVSSERAAVLEKEWGSKPLFNTEEKSSTEKLDTMPPTLLLKVEIARSIQPLKDEAIEPMRKIAGQRSFDTMILGNGSISYLIGNFITFESAQDFAGLLQRNGYKDARVVAWLGNREIDIQTARQLFETLK